MKHNLIALILAVTVMSWAQSSTPAPAPGQNSTPAKASCPCCEKMASADHKGMDCCMHHDATGKDSKEMPCCVGKDAKDSSCCGGKDAKSSSKDDKAAASCCGAGKPGEGHEMACCAKDAKDGANGCCSSKQCGKHEHADHPTSGN